MDAPSAAIRRTDKVMPEAVAHEVLSLPIFPELTQSQLDEVVAGVRAFFGR